MLKLRFDGEDLRLAEFAAVAGLSPMHAAQVLLQLTTDTKGKVTMARTPGHSGYTLDFRKAEDGVWDMSEGYRLLNKGGRR